MLKRTINFKRLEKHIMEAKEKRLNRMGSEIINELIERTQHGKDVNLRPFKKYSKLYGQSKKKTHGSKKPNLTRTGNMLNAIRHKKIKGGIRIYIASTAERKKAHGNQIKNKRNFFGIDRRQIARIAKKL